LKAVMIRIIVFINERHLLIIINHGEK